MKTEIFPDDQPDVIVDKFLKAQGEVEVHYKAQPYDLGPQTIKITNKNVPLTIIGLDQNGKKVKQNTPGMMPAIRGTSAGLLTGQNPKDCGIFSIGPGCSVEMNGLRLIHEIPNYADNAMAHGSATIANLVDNTKESSLTLTNCAIETNATTAISIRSDTARGAAPLNKPVNHIKVCDCQVTGKANTGIVGGNYSSINLGYWGKAPLDMRHANFEISGCTINSSVFGMIVGNVLGDSKSRFDVTKNQVGLTAFGVCFMSRPNVATNLAKGDINILNNTIKIEKYLDMPENPGEPGAGAAGILVRVSSVEDGQKVKTTIKSNQIDMTNLPKPLVNYKYNQGIVYELVPPVAQPELLKDVTYHESQNTVLLAKARIA